MTDECPDVVVVGAGIIGLATAYYLAQAGASVVLLESRDIAAGTSGACDGSVMLQSKHPGPVLELAKASAILFPQLIEEIGGEIEFERIGSLTVFESQEDFSALQPLASQQRASGLEIQVLSATEAREVQPGLGDTVIAASYLPTDAVVDQLALCFALARAARARGVRIRTGVTVTGIGTGGGSVNALHTDRGSISTPAAVIALGVWTPQLLAEVGINVEIVPRRGHILVTGRMPPVLRTVVLSPSYLRRKHEANAAMTPVSGADSVSFSMHQSRIGTCFIGSSREFAGYDDDTSTDVLGAIASEAMRVIPALSNASVIRSYAGLRPYTPDRRPVIGEALTCRGLFVAAGHEGDGIALGPITGRIVADLVLGADPGRDLAPFAPGRSEQVNAADS